MSRLRTTTLLTLVLTATLALPAASAEATDAADATADATTAATNPVREAVQCLLGPHIPETFVYYILWGCTAGQYVPEPVDAYTGCRVEFGARVVCSGGLSDLVYDLTRCRIGFPESYCQLSEPAANPVREALVCITSPHFPETSAYQVVWFCTMGSPEPIEHLTGCRPSSPPDLSCLPA